MFKTYYSIDLFSGPGGICTGFKWANIYPLIAVEISDWTVKTYQKSHNADVLPLDLYLENPDDFNHLFKYKKDNPTLLIHGDITKVTNELFKKILHERFNRESIDIVTGGAPCESFSMAGARCEADERNTLFLNIIRVARAFHSKMFLFENVKGLFSKKNDGIKGKMYEDICNEFESKDHPSGVSFRLASRDKDTVLLNSQDYGVPQARERIILIGINDRYEDEFSYPTKTHGENRKYPHVTVGEALSGLPTIKSGEGDEILPSNYDNQLCSLSKAGEKFLNIMKGEVEELEYLPHVELNLNETTYHKAVNHSKKMVKRMSLIKQGEGMKKAADRMINEGTWEKYKEYFPNKIYAARNRRLKIDAPSFTVTSHCLDEMIHPTENRGITPREAARLQSFPDWYQFEGPYVMFHGHTDQDKYEQIGDAIPPLLAYALGNEIHDTLSKLKSK